MEGIQAEALNLGFSLFGIAKPFALEKTRLFQNWLDRGFQGSMGYLSRPDAVAKRFSPTQLVNGCRTIISLGYSYSLNNIWDSPESIKSGWISSYALSADYHSLLIRSLEQLVTYIRSKIGTKHIFRVFTDSAPILERELGVLGNLGWIGKNANLISPVIGSHFLLAEIYTNLEIDPEQDRIPDRCGKCHRCIDACPTQCIQSYRTIDARKRISYLTIENNSEIPVNLREKIGQWVFGCDICQTVCPWNRYSQKGMEILRTHRISPVVNLAKQLNFSKKEFETHYSGTPVLRSGWMGFLRNLIIAAGNLKDMQSLSLLKMHLNGHASPMIRSHAAWAIGKCDVSGSRTALIEALDTERDLSVVAEIRSALV